MESPWAIVLSIAVIVVMIAIFIVSVASGIHIGPVASRNLFTAIGTMIMLLIALILRRRAEKNTIVFVMPDVQRMVMGYVSPFVFLGLIISYMKVFSHYSMAFHWTLLFVTLVAGVFLIVFGTRKKRKAEKLKQYNTGCWMQWISVWCIMLFLMSLFKVMDL